MEASLFGKRIEYHWVDGEERYIEDDNREWIWDRIKDGETFGEIAHYDIKNGNRYFGHWQLKR